MVTRRQLTARRMRELFLREVGRHEEPAAVDDEIPTLTPEEAQLEEPLLAESEVEQLLEAKLCEAPLPLERLLPPPIPDGGYRTDRFFKGSGK